MTGLCEQTLSFPAEPALVARALQGLPGAFWLDSGYPRRRAILGAFPLGASQAWDPEPDLESKSGTALSARVPRWVGLIPYEACRQLEGACWLEDPRATTSLREVSWWRYGAVVLVDERVTVVGDDPAAVARLVRALEQAPLAFDCTLSRFESAEPDSLHMAAIGQILRHIDEGRVYQVNLARCFEGRAVGAAFALYERLFADATVPFGFAFELDSGLKICAASPELCLLQRANGELVTRPIKGTRPRGPEPVSDGEQIRQLQADPKERAELVMVVDLERNDLGRLSSPGSVEVLSPGTVETYEALHHRVATIRSRLNAGTSRETLLRGFLPSGSVTGTPKRSAMQLIATLERQRRGLYTGAVGYIAQDGGMRLAMAIRTLVVEPDGQARYFAGGGIVADSRPESEVAETLWKSAQLLRLGREREEEASKRPQGDRSCEQSFAENWADWLGSDTEERESIWRAAESVV